MPADKTIFGTHTCMGRDDCETCHPENSKDALRERLAEAEKLVATNSGKIDDALCQELARAREDRADLVDRHRETMAELVRQLNEALAQLQAARKATIAECAKAVCKGCRGGMEMTEAKDGHYGAVSRYVYGCDAAEIWKLEQ